MANKALSLDPAVHLPEDVLETLSERFGFDPIRPDICAEVSRIARRYKCALGLFADAQHREAGRHRHRALHQKAVELRELLSSPDFDALGSEIDLYLRTQNPSGQSNLVLLPSAPGYYAVAQMLQTPDHFLELISATAETVELRNAPPKVRKPDYPLESLMRNMAQLWSDVLGRNFTLDYHKGSVLTEAAEFVIAIAAMIAPDVPQTRLITAMRTIVAERNFVPPTK